MVRKQNQSSCSATWQRNCLALFLLALLLVLPSKSAWSEQKVEQYPDGTTFRRYHVDAHGRLHGEYKEFSRRGTLKIKAFYVAGIMHGPYTEYHKNGVESMKTQYVKGQRHGQYEEYHENKKLKLRTWYKSGLRQGGYQEFYPNTAPRIITSYKDDKRHGACTEYRANGLVYVKTKYQNGLVHGRYEEFYPNGKLHLRCTYSEGKLKGDYEQHHSNGTLWLKTSYPLQASTEASECWDRSGENLAAYVRIFSRTPEERAALRARLGESFTGTIISYTKTRTEIYATLQRLHPKTMTGSIFVEEPVLQSPHKAGSLSEAFMEAGLQQVKIYRFLCDLVYDDMSLRDEYNLVAQHGAVLLNEIGHLEHTPPKPATMAADFFKLAYRGTSEGNLYAGQGSLMSAVDGFMDDSDESNIDEVGHRRWILNPSMLQTGFGFAEGYSIMYSFDCERKDVPDWEVTAFPAMGFYPADYFGKHYAWSLSPNAKYYEFPQANKLTVTVQEVDAQYNVVQELSLNHVGVAASSIGSGKAVVFRPELPDDYGERRYRVRITGLKRRGQEEKATLEYITEFFKLNDLPE